MLAEENGVVFMEIISSTISSVIKNLFEVFLNLPLLLLFHSVKKVPAKTAGKLFKVINAQLAGQYRLFGIPLHVQTNYYGFVKHTSLKAGDKI